MQGEGVSGKIGAKYRRAKAPPMRRTVRANVQKYNKSKPNTDNINAFIKARNASACLVVEKFDEIGNHNANIHGAVCATLDPSTCRWMIMNNAGV